MKKLDNIYQNISNTLKNNSIEFIIYTIIAIPVSLYIIITEGWFCFIDDVAFIVTLMLPHFMMVNIYLLTKKLIEIKKAVCFLILETLFFITVPIIVFSTFKGCMIVWIAGGTVALVKLLFLFIIREKN
jgi:hypothetical protein